MFRCPVCKSVSGSRAMQLACPDVLLSEGKKTASDAGDGLEIIKKYTAEKLLSKSTE